MQQRTETDARDGAQAGATLILTFRLERFDNDGNRLQPIPIEMRGRSFEGALADGDWVEVSGGWRDGTLRAKRVQDLTTGAVIRARSKLFTRALPFLVFLLVALVALAALGGLNLLNGLSFPGGGPGTELRNVTPRPTIGFPRDVLRSLQLPTPAP